MATSVSLDISVFLLRSSKIKIDLAGPENIYLKAETGQAELTIYLDRDGAAQLAELCGQIVRMYEEPEVIRQERYKENFRAEYGFSPKR